MQKYGGDRSSEKRNTRRRWNGKAALEYVLEPCVYIALKIQLPDITSLTDMGNEYPV